MNPVALPKKKTETDVCVMVEGTTLAVECFRRVTQKWKIRKSRTLVGLQKGWSAHRRVGGKNDLGCN